MAALTSLALVTVGSDAEELKAAAIAYNDELIDSFDHVLPLTVNPGLFNPESSGQSDLERQILMFLGFVTETPLVGCVYASSVGAFGETTAVQELVFAICRREGVDLVIAGEAFEPWAIADKETRLLRNAAWSAVHLRAILRAHDAGAVRYTSPLAA
jgi:hypothetical protein